MLDAARPHLLRIVGPNCLGIIVPGRGLNATFAHLGAQSGKLAFVTQSGAVLAGVLDWASARDIGFSHLVSVGDMVDVDFGDLLDYLALDPATSAILLYVEAVTHARKFMSAARAAARLKPVIVLKAGRHEEGARRPPPHRGARRRRRRPRGRLPARRHAPRADAAGAVRRRRDPGAERAGGRRPPCGRDQRRRVRRPRDRRPRRRGGRLAVLSAETLARLDAVLPPAWSRGNPVDLVGDAPGRRYADALSVLFEDRGVDAILALNCPTAIASSVEAARAVSETMRTKRRIPLVAGWVGDSAMAVEARRTLERLVSPSTRRRKKQ